MNMKKRDILIIFGTMCMILMVAIVIQIKTIRNANMITGNGANSELKTEVLRWKERYDASYKELEKSEKELEKQRTAATENDDDSKKMQDELNKLNSLIGTIDVKGKGIIITVADNNAVTNQTVSVLENISNYLIHDTDLLFIVNELKNAGAEAISINDERIINQTAITCDGNVILVNGNKISSPFTIKAIGSQEIILGAIQRPGGFLEELNSYGLVSSVTRQSNINIYKYNGVIN